jgi:hypothetical protein
MALSFGTELHDVTTDPDGLRTLLESAPAPDDAGALADGAFEPLAADPDPGWDEPGLGERIGLTGKGTAPQQRPVSRAVKKDIQGKIALAGGLLAGAWQTRDPLCGGAASDAMPAISEALTDILCDSPDVVRWFTSGGSYMKWLNLLLAVQPVLQVAVQHHVLHTADTDEPPFDAQQPAPDWSGYGA